MDCGQVLRKKENQGSQQRNRMLLPYHRRKQTGTTSPLLFLGLVQKCVCLNGCLSKKAKSGIKSGKKNKNYYFKNLSSNQLYIQEIWLKTMGINLKTIILSKLRYQQSFPLCQAVSGTLELLYQPQHQKGKLDRRIRQFTLMSGL